MNKRPREEGFCSGGCLMLGVVVVVIVGALIWGGVSTYQSLYLMTSPAPRDLGPLPTATEQNAMEVKLTALQQAIAQGGESEFRFTAKDLNAWLFANGRNRDLGSHLRFAFDRDWLVAEVSVPLRFMRQIPGLPAFQDRFFNGKVAARLKVENGELKVENFDVVGNERRLPWLFTGQSYRQTLSEAVQSGIKDRFADGSDLLVRVQSVKIENGELVLKIKRRGT